MQAIERNNKLYARFFIVNWQTIEIASLITRSNYVRMAKLSDMFASFRPVCH